MKSWTIWKCFCEKRQFKSLQVLLLELHSNRAYWCNGKHTVLKVLVHKVIGLSPWFRSLQVLQLELMMMRGYTRCNCETESKNIWKFSFRKSLESYRKSLRPADTVRDSNYFMLIPFCILLRFGASRCLSKEMAAVSMLTAWLQDYVKCW